MADFTWSVTTAEERRLQEFLTALRTPCTANMDPGSVLNTEEFESEFRSKLLAHHCFMGSPLFQESFDTLKLDRSDAKITLANINKDLCLVHGTWQLSRLGARVLQPAQQSRSSWRLTPTTLLWEGRPRRDCRRSIAARARLPQAAVEQG